MTASDPLPDHGAREAPRESGYDDTLPSHVGDVVVRATGIEKYFGDNHVLRGVDLEVRQREAVMLLGRSGSGKTTLLRCINFLEEPPVGSVEIDGLKLEADPLRARSRKHQEQIRQMRLRAVPRSRPLPPKAFARVRRFQSAHGLQVDGVAGPITLGGSPSAPNAPADTASGPWGPARRN